MNASARYRSYAVVVTKTGSSASLTSIGELKLFAESFSVDEGVVEFPGGSKRDSWNIPVAPMTDYITRTVGATGRTRRVRVVMIPVIVCIHGRPLIETR